MSTWVSDWHTFSLPVLHKLHEEKKMLVMLTQDCTTTRQNANTNRGALNCKKKLDTFGHHKCPPSAHLRPHHGDEFAAAPPQLSWENMQCLTRHLISTGSFTRSQQHHFLANVQKSSVASFLKESWLGPRKFDAGVSYYTVAAIPAECVPNSCQDAASKICPTYVLANTCHCRGTVSIVRRSLHKVSWSKHNK